MSHLPLDARAILHYLNDLGYRNITAEQLREFLKGMQPQPDQSGSSSKQPTTKIGQLQQQQEQQQQQQQQHQSLPQKSTPTHKQVKIIKGKRPLCYFKFYLDICDHQLTKRIEEQIKALGGNLEFFLTESVTHFITDKTVIPPLSGGQPNNFSNSNSRPNTPQTPVTPNTPQTPYSALEPNDARFASGATPIGTARRTRQSRADAILNRARRQGSNVVAPTTATTPTTTRPIAGGSLKSQTTLAGTATTPPYKIWQTEQALNFFKKITTELKEYLNKDTTHKSASGSRGNVTNLKGSYIKIEVVKQNYRPYYHVLKKPDEWPKIDLSSDDGAFRLQPRQKPALITADAAAQQQVMTRKSRTRSSQQLPHTKASNDTQLKQTPLPAAVEALKQPERNNPKANTATATPTTTPHSPICKEVKDSSDKQCGVCEICKIEYDTLTIHLKTKDHQYFVKNPANFIALDTLIKSTADVNKFLAEENISHLTDSKDPKTAELEEMEVDELASKVEENITDPLNDSAAVATARRSNSAESSKQRPSPALREKSKRSTKGKHSSEKFQSNLSATKQTPAKSVSPPKKPASSSMVELQRMDTVAVAANAASPKTTRRKTTPASTLSPPIRAMLPPSSLYKVVETPEICTPTRSRRGGTGVDCTEAVASPSIIVKFQKVRQNELQRLNGEAENFMFPKTRTSSELLTDIDRQTTSDRTRVSLSSSLDSTSETDLTSSAQDSNSAKDFGRKMAIAKRRKCNNAAAAALSQRKLSTGSNSSSSRQRFQSAPIQPEVQLKSEAATASTTTITLPEATRKSSRTATAIVTKATASSRLLRAQVEAAKQTNRQRQNANAKTLVEPTIKKEVSVAETPPVAFASRRRSAITVVKREDRMGEKVAIKKEIAGEYQESETFENETQFNDEDVYANAGVDDDDDDDDDDEEEDDDEDDDDDDYKKDADYVASKAITKRKLAMSFANSTRHESRDERASRRQTRLSLNKTVSIENEIELEPSIPPTKAAKKLATPPAATAAAATKLKTPKSKSTKSSSPTKGKQQKKQPAPHIFDYTKSEYLSKLTYAFECLPTSDLWHRVYTRQDAGEERYHAYFGLTRYRKLPYEMGPIPFKTTLKTSSCCALCNKQESADMEIVSSKRKFSEKMSTDCKPQPTCNETVTEPQIKQEQSKHASYKHKKLHLLQRYQQEQQALLKQEVDKVEPPLSKELPKTESVESKGGAQMAQIAAIKPLLANTALPKCDSKASTPELLEREFAPFNELTASERLRADSTHSNTSSSYASSTASHSKKLYRNKHLNRLTELPPRKSPREHASTLALVSCMIRQRQDSLSKNNSEVDEAPTTPTPTAPTKMIDHLVATVNKQEPTKNATEIIAPQPRTPVKQKTPEPIEKSVIESPRTTRSAAATPIEEIRFATEISENVKRMRRGQNKYDHSPPVVHKAVRAGRGRQANQLPLATTSGNTFSRRLVLAAKQDLTASVVLGKRKRREKPNQSMTVKHRAQYNSNHTTSNAVNGIITGMPGVRKLGTKKGVLEFEFDNAALKRLDLSTQYTNPNFEAWMIDRYLDIAGKEYDMEPMQIDVATATDDDNAKCEVETDNALEERMTAENAVGNTPPPTDCFTSDFDLYDLMAGTQSANGCGDDDEPASKRRNSFSFYSTTSLQNYYRKRKSLKSNRTGWPKAQKRKTTLRHQRLHDEKINFQKMGIGTDLVQIKEEPTLVEDEHDGEEDDGEQANPDVADEAADEVQTKRADNDGGAELEDDKGGGGGRGGVITPPATDDDEQIEADDDNSEPEEADVGADADDSLPEEDGTLADSIDLDEEAAENEHEAEIEATDADAEEEADEDDEDDDDEDDDDDEADEFEDAYDHDANDVDIFDDAHTGVESTNKPSLQTTTTTSPVGQQQTTMLSKSRFVASEHKILASLLSSKTGVSATSTPSTQSTRNHLQMRRTPQLNGSLGSCISPSEKLGDTSDIFTVSSDGLDTDLDVSNQHAQLRTDDDHMSHQCPHQTPKRKYDITKYAPSNAKASTCAAEAATASAKSLAISQFLKKEVRVTCRRLRAPFRRFRYRR